MHEQSTASPRACRMTSKRSILRSLACQPLSQTTRYIKLRQNACYSKQGNDSISSVRLYINIYKKKTICDITTTRLQNGRCKKKREKRGNCRAGDECRMILPNQ